MQYQRLMDTMPESGELVKQLGQSAPCLPTAVPPLVNGDSMLNDQASAAAASAPPISEVFTESSCVICLDSSCHVIFLPCGHLCCCAGCGGTIDQCPLCRTRVARKLTVHL